MHAEREEANSQPNAAGTQRTGDSLAVDRELYCPECGYALHGCLGVRCPECGLSLEFIGAAESGIPWVHRRQRGRLRAYFQTVWLVMRRAPLVRREMYRAAEIDDARRFRLVTIAVAFGAALLTLPAWALLGRGTLQSTVADVGWWYLGLCYATILLSLIIATGLPADFFRARDYSDELNRRAAALSQYSCAALSLLPIAALLGIGGSVLLPARAPFALDILLLLLSGGVTLAAVLFWYLDTVRLARHLLPGRPAARRAAIFLPLLWLFVFLGVVLGIPLVAAGLAVILHSL